MMQRRVVTRGWSKERERVTTRGKGRAANIGRGVNKGDFGVWCVSNIASDWMTK